MQTSTILCNGFAALAYGGRSGADLPYGADIEQECFYLTEPAHLGYVESPPIPSP